MKKSCDYCLIVHTKLGKYLCHRHGMNEIRLAGLSQLTLVHFASKIIGLLYELNVI